ncbi:uncharacterized protein (DUF427 family) [Cryobacterium sp. MP_M5]|uniref:DUF427 domain-containing protein n=1 Tax=unclassified Cryobacterium TaxID=2649013 RepID=UPI0018CA7EF2|nr:MULTISPECIES: DUF427 domain-containing protein [unclassified Cryobacterium]MBG6056681.1 uncharacterized protein (DUF427 family) [Cryobacterium sp. MP_M3]MEC5176353.1 uncharacterized protein (DUF427 family) [Cryobacterium sp. MP_M5]
MKTFPSDRWVRAFVEGATVVDSRDPLLFWEDGFAVPGYAFSAETVELALLSESADAPVRRGFDFFGPKGKVRTRFDVVSGERMLPHAAWVLAGLADRIVFTWRPGLIDRWQEEDVVVRGHPRDPFHRVDALPSSRQVRVAADGVVLADTRHPVLLFETGLPTRFYIPQADVRLDLLRPAATTSVCAYKGQADRYWDVSDDPNLTSVAWSYSRPTPAVAEIAELVAFYNERVDITVDGAPQERPASPFSDPAHRPA